MQENYYSVDSFVVMWNEHTYVLKEKIGSLSKWKKKLNNLSYSAKVCMLLEDQHVFLWLVNCIFQFKSNALSSCHSIWKLQQIYLKWALISEEEGKSTDEFSQEAILVRS